jgi:HK97 family phage major capsid protein
MTQITENAEHLTNVSKAEFTLSHLLASGGYLLPEQARKFIQLLIKKSVIVSSMTTYGMAAQKRKLNKIRFGERVLKPGTPGQALPQADRVRPDLSEVELDTQLFKCEVLIEDEVFEDNIEGPALRNTIMQMLGEAISRDVEWIALNGDVLSADPVLAKLDGLLKQATSHTADGGATKLSSTGLSKARKALPHEYKQDPRIMRWWTSVNAEQDFGDTISDRATPLGDKHFEEHPGPRYKATPVVGVPEMPEDYGGVDTTAALYLDPKNAHMGIHSRIRLRVTEDVQAGNVIIVGKIRFDVKYANEDAVAKLYNIDVSA